MAREEGEVEMVARRGIRRTEAEEMDTEADCGTYPESEVVPVEGRAC